MAYEDKSDFIADTVPESAVREAVDVLVEQYRPSRIHRYNPYKVYRFENERIERVGLLLVMEPSENETERTLAAHMEACVLADVIPLANVTIVVRTPSQLQRTQDTRTMTGIMQEGELVYPNIGEKSEN